MLTSMTVTDPAEVMVVWPKDVPNPAWLQTGIPSAGQQTWGATQLGAYPFVAFPSVVSKFSWNIVFRPDRATRKYTLLGQDPLLLDTRLNPPMP
jgi:RES domain-containing protein